MACPSELENEPSCCVLFPLQGVERRLRETGHAEMNCSHQAAMRREPGRGAQRDSLADTTSNLAQTSQMVKQVDAVFWRCAISLL
jgi:hypothetical protein